MKTATLAYPGHELATAHRPPFPPREGMASSDRAPDAAPDGGPTRLDRLRGSLRLALLLTSGLGLAWVIGVAHW
jgi:hypothetical protein